MEWACGLCAGGQQSVPISLTPAHSSKAGNRAWVQGVRVCLTQGSGTALGVSAQGAGKG